MHKHDVGPQLHCISPAQGISLAIAVLDRPVSKSPRPPASEDAKPIDLSPGPLMMIQGVYLTPVQIGPEPLI